MMTRKVSDGAVAARLIGGLVLCVIGGFVLCVSGKSLLISAVALLVLLGRGDAFNLGRVTGYVLADALFFALGFYIARWGFKISAEGRKS